MAPGIRLRLVVCSMTAKTYSAPSGAVPGAKVGISRDGITYRDAGNLTGRGRVRRCHACGV
ncbi:hypothetical protein SBI_00617 [Streptomyces bingchenggensis BCW-1]|uniref:Uncharacterized protein n=1 Tax=Streptomyces bingchenggensis (strain BCW-1) TaxID=749414 RepID=D7C284_STRBB|nr:hypothetical protein SBI_00617 [Streptomyces bingchenggensis BCW-1]